MSIQSQVNEFIETNTIEMVEGNLYLIESNRRKWTRVKSRLDEGQSKISKRLDDYYSQSGKLKNISKTWEVTKKAEKDTAILSVITKRTDEILITVTELNSKIISLIEFFLLQSDKVALRQVKIDLKFIMNRINAIGFFGIGK